MNALFKSYQNFLLKFPVGVQAIQTGLLMGSGDLIAQIFVEQKCLQKIDLLRIGQFTFVGTCFVGPPLRIWYGLLENYLGSKGKTAAIKKVAADQLLFAPCFLAVIMSIVGVVQGNSTKEIVRRVERDYPDVLRNNYKLWPAVQLCNFYLVPLQYQVVSVQFVAILWNTYLSWKMNQTAPDKFIGLLVQLKLLSFTCLLIVWADVSVCLRPDFWKIRLLVSRTNALTHPKVSKQKQL